MKYNETIEILDDRDKKIFYHKFLWNQTISYGLGLLGAFCLFFDLNLGDISSYYIFIVAISISILFFTINLSNFRSILQENKKKVIRGKIWRKAIDKSSVAPTNHLGYWLHFENNSIEVPESTYHYISVGDYIALHCHTQQGGLGVFRYETSKKLIYAP